MHELLDKLLFVCVLIANMDTRLTGGHLEGEGNVELLYNNEWVGICDGNWDSIDGAAVCRSIGYWYVLKKKAQNNRTQT